MSDENLPYLHGFSKEEQERLLRQARFAEQAIYKDIDFSDVKQLLEVGCGVGAQSQILMRRFPQLELTGIDLNDKQLEACKENLKGVSWATNRYRIKKMDASNLNFESHHFDGAFLCWVLEHISHPQQVLSEVRRVLRPGGQIVVSEVMNHSFFLDPYSPNVWKFWMAYNDFQYENSGDPFIGAKLGNLLNSVGFRDIETNVITWHFDNRNPAKRKEFIDHWMDLLLSGADALVSEKVIEQETVDLARKELQAVAKNPNAVFYDSFMQASAKAY